MSFKARCRVVPGGHVVEGPVVKAAAADAVAAGVDKAQVPLGLAERDRFAEAPDGVDVRGRRGKTRLHRHDTDVAHVTLRQKSTWHAPLVRPPSARSIPPSMPNRSGWRPAVTT